MPQPAPIEMQSMPAGSSYPPPPPRHPAAANPPAYEDRPGSLGRNYRDAEDRARAATRPVEGAFDTESYYGLGAAGWFAFTGLILLLFPRLILFFAVGNDYDQAYDPSRERSEGIGLGVGRPPRPASLTSLESLALRVLGLGSVALAAALVFVVVPAYKPVAPGRKAMITTMAVLGCVTAVVCWNSPLGAIAVITGLGNGLVGAGGWWTIMFGEEKYKFGKYLKKDSRMKRL